MNDRSAVVTGAASGIGLESVRRLIKDGYAIAAIDIDRENLEREMAAMSISAERIMTFDIDVSDEEAVNSVIDRTNDYFGRIDVLVNNAGIGTAEPLHTTSTEQWDRIMDVNLTGPFLCSRAVLPIMLEGGGGVILNIASVAALVGVRNRAVYCASKAGLLGLTRSMAVDYARRGIRVVAICPGTVDSPWIRKILSEDPDPVKRREEMAARQLDGRLGTPEEIAAAVSFLASDEARFVNGSAFVIDGGMTAI